MLISSSARNSAIRSLARPTSDTPGGGDQQAGMIVARPRSPDLVQLRDEQDHAADHGREPDERGQLYRTERPRATVVISSADVAHRTGEVAGHAARPSPATSDDCRPPGGLPSVRQAGTARTPSPRGPTSGTSSAKDALAGSAVRMVGRSPVHRILLRWLTSFQRCCVLRHIPGGGSNSEFVLAPAVRRSKVRAAAHCSRAGVVPDRGPACPRPAFIGSSSVCGNRPSNRHSARSGPRRQLRGTSGRRPAPRSSRRRLFAAG